MANIVFDISEIIGLIKKSKLPTVIIEGSDDVIVYRRMEDLFDDVELSVMPVGGRENVIKIFERLHEFPNRENLAFIADKDAWTITGVPSKYIFDRFIFTDGYSLENDVFRDGNIERLLRKKELLIFDLEIKKFTRWYALAINRFNSGVSNVDLSLFPGIILDSDCNFEDQLMLNDGEIYPHSIYDDIISDYSKYIRGKSLMQIIGRQLAHKKRRPRIHSDYFLDSVGASPGKYISKIFVRIGEIFGSSTSILIK